MIYRIVSVIVCGVIFTIVSCKSEELAESILKYTSCDHIKIVSSKVYSPFDYAGVPTPWRNIVYTCSVEKDLYDPKMRYYIVRGNEEVVPPLGIPSPDLNEKDKVFFKLRGYIDTLENIVDIAINPKIIIFRPGMDTCIVQIEPDSILKNLQISQLK